MRFTLNIYKYILKYYKNRFLWPVDSEITENNQTQICLMDKNHLLLLGGSPHSGTFILFLSHLGNDSIVGAENCWKGWLCAATSPHRHQHEGLCPLLQISDFIGMEFKLCSAPQTLLKTVLWYSFTEPQDVCMVI